MNFRSRVVLVTVALGIGAALTSSTAVSADAASRTGVTAPAAGTVPATAAAVEPTLVGAASSDWRSFDRAVGPVQIYRNFDGGFSYSRWTDTDAHRLHPDAAQFDYSTKVNPRRILNDSDPINDQLRAFLATTPRNIIFTNFHEPDNETSHLFTPAEFRASIVKVAEMVRAQNARDGGTRMTSVTLMKITFTTYGRSTADMWWPTVARDGGRADIIQADAYALPNATNTPCCPPGYTSGNKWQPASQVLAPVRNFAASRGIQWAIAELGYLEDINNPTRKANALRDAVAYANANGAHHINYFDASGPRASWKLRYSFPVGTMSDDSNAARMWKSLVPLQ